jgi:hypothetical protein
MLRVVTIPEGRVGQNPGSLDISGIDLAHRPPYYPAAAVQADCILRFS